MDAAQMLTAQEIARQCERLANLARRDEHPPGSAQIDAGHHADRDQARRFVDPITRPIPPVTEPGQPGHGDEPVGSDELTEREQRILAFERQWWKRPGTKERAVRELFGMSEAGYHQVLDALVDEPEAYRVDPMLIKRLRKVRASRQRARDARRLGIEWH